MLFVEGVHAQMLLQELLETLLSMSLCMISLSYCSVWLCDRERCRGWRYLVMNEGRTASRNINSYKSLLALRHNILPVKETENSF